MKVNSNPTFNNSKIKNKPYDKYANVPEAYMRIAEGMESQFNQMMIAQMKKTINRADPHSPAARVYDEMLDQHYADIMASKDGVGIKDVVLEQIYPGFNKTPKRSALNNYQNQIKGNGHESH